MLKIGITGGIGSGKSTVSRLFRLMGYPVYIADIESKKLTATSPVIKIKLIEAFGKDLYEGDVLNKQLLASYIFHDRKKLQLADSIIHPEVQKHFLNWMEVHNACPAVLQEAAILYESGFDKLMDKVIMVYAPENIRIERVLKRENISREQVLDRIKNQMPDEQKCRLADYIICNDGTQSLISQVLSLIEEWDIRIPDK